jgi:hypothetical protein
MRYLTLIFALFMLAVGPSAANNQKITANYAIYAGGIHAMDAQFLYTQKNSTYSSTMHIKPVGWVGKLLPWGGTYRTNGRIDANGLLWPLQHNNESTWRDERDVTRLNFNKQGQLAGVQQRDYLPNGALRNAYPVNFDSSNANTIDIMSAVFRTLLQASGQLKNQPANCTRQNLVFDGKRRYNLAFTTKKPNIATKTKYNNYAGPYQLCQFEVKPVAGFEGKPRGFYAMQQESRKLGQLPFLWIAQLKPNTPYMPVRMQLKSGYGTVIMHFQNAQFQ